MPRLHRRVRTLLTALAVVALAAAGCETDGDGEPDFAPFEAAVPTAELLLLDAPSIDIEPAMVSAGLAVQQAALVGEVSELRQEAAEAKRRVNSALRGITDPLAEVIRRQEPVFQTQDKAVWRGSHGADDPDVHVLIVERKEDGHFEFQAWSRLRAEPDARWRGRIFGQMTPSDEPGRGRGATWVNFQTDNDERTRGRVLALWSDIRGRRELDVTFFDATPDDASPRTLSYHFVRDRDGSGVLTFGPQVRNIHRSPAKSKLETVAHMSRWDRHGIGRTDLSARGGDIADSDVSVAVQSQCWQASDRLVTYEATYARRMATDAIAVVSEEGDASACPFARPMVAPVMSPGAPPDLPVQPPLD